VKVPPDHGQVAVVINPVAGRGRGAKVAPEIQSRIGGLSNIEVIVPSSRDASYSQLKDLAPEVDRLIVVGGDGMVHAAAQYVAARHPTTVLGVIGLGTGNDFAAAVGLDTDLDVALEQAFSEPAPVDALAVGDDWVTTVVTFGFAAQVNERAERMAFPRGSSRYTVATLLETPRVSGVPVEMTLDGVRSRHDVMMAAVANTALFGGGMRIAPDASHSDGRLDVVLIDEVSRVTLLRVLPRAFSGGHVAHPAVSVSRGSIVEFASPHQRRVRADGEALGMLPIRVESVPGALLVAGANG